MHPGVLSLILIPTFLFTGCGGAGSARSDVERPGSVMDGREGAVFVLDRGASEGEFVVAAGPDVVWRALFDAYEALGIEIGHVEADARVLGNRSFVARRTLAGERLSVFFDCGVLNTGRPAADAFRIQVDMLSRLTPGAETTRLTTTVAAIGRDAAGTRSDPVRCTSTGRLEASLARALVAALAEALAPGG